MEMLWPFINSEKEKEKTMEKKSSTLIQGGK